MLPGVVMGRVSQRLPFNTWCLSSRSISTLIGNAKKMAGRFLKQVIYKTKFTNLTLKPCQ